MAALLLNGSATPSRGHSTTDPRFNLRALAHSSVEEQSVDLERNNRWLMEFMEGVEGARKAGRGERPALATLLKSARKPRASPLPTSTSKARLASNNSPSLARSISKGLLFPSNNAHSPRSAGKENAHSPAPSARGSPTARDALSSIRSPLSRSASSASVSRVGLGSPLGMQSASSALRGLASPRPVAGSARKASPVPVAQAKKKSTRASPPRSQQKSKSVKKAPVQALIVEEEEEEEMEEEEDEEAEMLAAQLAAKLEAELKAKEAAAAAELALAQVEEEEEEEQMSSDDTSSDLESDGDEVAQEDRTVSVEADLSAIVEEESEDEPEKQFDIPSPPVKRTAPFTATKVSPVAKAASPIARSPLRSTESVDSIVAETQAVSTTTKNDASRAGERITQSRTVSAASAASETYEDADEDLDQTPTLASAEFAPLPANAPANAATLSPSNTAESSLATAIRPGSSASIAKELAAHASPTSAVPAPAQAEDEHTIPLNDKPSVLRTVGSLGSSIPGSASSTTRTPGGTTTSSRFTLPTSAGPPTAAKQLVFKPLGAKKSLGPASILASRPSAIIGDSQSTQGSQQSLKRKSTAAETDANKAQKTTTAEEAKATSPGANKRELMRQRLAGQTKRVSNFSANSYEAGLGLSSFTRPTPAAAVALLATAAPAAASVAAPTPTTAPAVAPAQEEDKVVLAPALFSPKSPRIAQHAAPPLVPFPAPAAAALSPPPAAPGMQRSSSVADRRMLFEQQRDGSAPSPSKPTPASLNPRSPTLASTGSFAQMPSSASISTNLVGANGGQQPFKPQPPRVPVKSPARSSPQRSAKTGHILAPSPAKHAAAVVVSPARNTAQAIAMQKKKVTTTPLGSPPSRMGFGFNKPSQVAMAQSAAGKRTIAQLTEADTDEEADNESDDGSELDPDDVTFAHKGGIRVVQQQQQQQQQQQKALSIATTVEDGQRDQEELEEEEDDLPELPSAPASARPSEGDELSLSHDPRPAQQQVPVKQGLKPVLAMSQKKVAMPGGFGGADSDEEDDGVAAQLVPQKKLSQSQQAPLNKVRTLTKQGSNSSLSSSASAATASKARIPTSTSNGTAPAKANVKQAPMGVVEAMRKAAEARDREEQRAAKEAQRKKETDDARRAAQARLKEVERQKLKEQDERQRKDIERARAAMGLKTASALSASGSTRNLAQQAGAGSANQQAFLKSSLNQSNGGPRVLNTASGSIKAQPSSSSVKPNAGAGSSSMIGVKAMMMKPNAGGPSVAGGPSFAPPKFAQNAIASSSSSAKQPSASAAKVKPKTPKAVIDEPYYELPDIDSEYSDDDEEAHAAKEKTFAQWVQADNLHKALVEQAPIDPEQFFAPIADPDLDDIFGRENPNREVWRKRSSSATWHREDMKAQLDQARYGREMGFVQGAKKARVQ